MKNFIIIVVVLIGSGFEIIDVQADNYNTWYLGEGLKKGDFFSYKLCSWDYNDCQEFKMDMWIDGILLLDSAIPECKEFTGMDVCFCYFRI